MRTQGAKSVTPRQKARILAKKNIQEKTLREIGAEEGVSKDTVCRITEESLPPEVVEMAKRYRDHFATYAEANAFKAEQQVFSTIHELSADKASKVAETQFNLARTIRGETTTNNTLSDADLARELLRRMVENYGWTREKTVKLIEERFPDVVLNTD